MIFSFEIPQGTSVFWTTSDASYGMDAGYGICSYPTYERGWRYARPFLTADQNADIMQLSYYFVRINNLERTAETIINDNESLQKSMQSRGFSVDEVVLTMTRYIDYIFYDKGVFCSPDLQLPVWQCTDAIWLCLFAASLAVIAYSFRKPKRHTLLISRQNEIMDTGTNR